MATAEIDIIAKLVVLDGKFDEVLAAFKALCKFVHNNEPGTTIYYAIKSEKKNEITVIERYKDSEAAKAHVESANSKAFLEETKSLLAGRPEISVGSYLTGFQRVGGETE